MSHSWLGQQRGNETEGRDEKNGTLGIWCGLGTHRLGRRWEI